jgi:hypothetical protein
MNIWHPQQQTALSNGSNSKQPRVQHSQQQFPAAKLLQQQQHCPLLLLQGCVCACCLS